MHEARIELLQRMPIFGGIRDDILGFLLALSPVVRIPQDRFFFREDDEGQSMFVLEEGRVAVLKRWQGADCLLRILERGDCFGEMALLDLRPRSASVRAVEDCAAIELSAAGLYQLYKKDLEQFAMIEMNMGREVSRRLRESDQRLFRARMGAADAGADYVFPAG
ncbi:MAG: Crp/Fnr family transcriptional regulator [Burkholderiales bacterium]